MKTSLITLTRAGIAVITLATSGVVFAETGETTPEGKGKPPKGEKGDRSPEMRLAHMTKELDLTSAQQTSVKAIMDETRSSVDALREDTTLTPDAKRAKMREIQAATKSKMDTVLTPEQQAKRDEMKAKYKEEKGPKADKKQKTPKAEGEKSSASTE